MVTLGVVPDSAPRSFLVFVALMAAIASPKTPLAKFVLTGLMLVVLGVGGTGVQAREWFGNRDERPQQDSVALSDLPQQGQRTYQAIFNGGPFRHDKDGSVFGNRERLLPREPRGHYREYTVDTPGSRDRGARRIVCGGAPTAPSACWYTADHYGSFRRIVP
jgi:ribonuclease T1